MKRFQNYCLLNRLNTHLPSIPFFLAHFWITQRSFHIWPMQSPMVNQGYIMTFLYFTRGHFRQHLDIHTF